MKMLKNKGPRMEPWRTPVEIFCHLLNLFPKFCSLMLICQIALDER